MSQKWSKEFKEDALRLAEKEGVPTASEKLGIAKRQIYDWRRERRLAAVSRLSGIESALFRLFVKWRVRSQQNAYLLKISM